MSSQDQQGSKYGATIWGVSKWGVFWELGTPGVPLLFVKQLKKERIAIGDIYRKRFRVFKRGAIEFEIYLAGKTGALLGTMGGQQDDRTRIRVRGAQRRGEQFYEEEVAVQQLSEM